MIIDLASNSRQPAPWSDIRVPRSFSGLTGMPPIFTMQPIAQRRLQSNTLQSRTFPCEKKCEACLDVATLDNKVSGLRRAIAELEVERFYLLSNANDCHDTIRKRLPTELFIKILELSLPIPDTISYDTSRLEILGPLVFSAVSRRWRALVSSTPSLWAVVPIHRGGVIPSEVEGLMYAWINRSGQRLLSIVINIDRQPSQPHPHFISRIINQYAHRLQYLRVEAPFPMINELDFGDSSAQSISTLALKTSGSDIPHNMTAKLKFGQELRPATLKLRYISLELLRVHVDRLTHVQLFWLPMVDCTNLLARAHMMVDLSINEIKRPRATETKPLIIHQNLRYLRIISQPNLISSILNSLSVPSLQHLEVEVHTPSVNNGEALLLFENIAQCLQRSSAKLESLHIRALPLEPIDGVYSSLKTLIYTVSPSIRHLVIRVSSTSDWHQHETPWKHLIDCFFNEQTPLPLLQSITLNGIYKIWLLYLKTILVSASQWMSAHGARPITVIMPFYSTPLNNDNGNDISPDIYRNGTLPLSASETGEMLSLMKEFGMTVKMPVTRRGQEQDDVFADVLDVLTNASLEEQSLK